MATMTLTEVKRKLRERDFGFEFADLSGLDLSNLDMTLINGYHANFRDSNCVGTLFVGATLTYADFTGAFLRYAVFQFADLEQADFNMASLQAASFSKANLEGANFVDAVGIPTGDHTLIGSLLKANAGEDTIKLAIASMVMVNYDYCWLSFAKMFLANPLFNTPAIHEWVSETFRPFPPLANQLADTLEWVERVKARKTRQQQRLMEEYGYAQE